VFVFSEQAETMRMLSAFYGFCRDMQRDVYQQVCVRLGGESQTL
jgi:hypothetical protein